MTGKIEFQPAPGKIAVKVIGESQFLGQSKLILAPASRVNPRTTGEVVAVYEPFMVQGEETEPFFKIGDRVIFGLHGGIEIEYGREKVIILREQEILTKVVVKSEEDLADVGVASPAGGAFDDLEG